MTLTRRNLIKSGLAAGTAISLPSVLRAAQTAPAPGRTVRMVMGADLQVFDPVYTTTNITTCHALAIYDTLFDIDSKLMPKPQMVGKWGVSEDKKTYTFELRDGLGWHDGTPVTAADCVASIRRWAQVYPGGQIIMARASDISKRDDKTFTIALKEPLGLLIDILAASYPFIMREKDANRPATEQVAANIGSGPFKFNKDLFRSGASVVYDPNEKYVPRDEASDGRAGGKIVKVDRVVWDNIGDQQTALAGLQAGEMDFIRTPSFDLLSVVENDPALAPQVMDRTGNVNFIRMNFLQKPFDNVKARQAILHLVDQAAFMRAGYGNPQYFGTVKSIFGNDSPYSNDENTGWYKDGGDPEKARQLFKEGGYAGEKVVILDPTNVPEFHNMSQLLAAALRKIGVNAELAPSDWNGVAARRMNKGPVESGGWSIFISTYPGSSLGNPIAPISAGFLLANGDKAYYGWPKNDEYETLRTKWADVETLEEGRTLARKMQGAWWDFVGSVLLGQSQQVSARRKALTGLISVPEVIPMWNMQKG